MSSIKRENGFTVIELSLVIVLIGVGLFLISISFVGTRNNLALQSAGTEVEGMMKRAYNIALEEGVDVYLAFYDDTGDHPNRSAIYRVYPDGTNEWDDDTPTEPPPTGMRADNDGSGHYWVKLADGSASVAAPATILFRREGALVTVSPEPPEGEMSVTVVVAGKTRTISVNDRGEVTIYK